MYTIRETYHEHKIKDEGKYKCECGYKFKRTFTGTWTENPFNKLWMSGHPELCDKKCNERIDEYLSKRKCPKCGKECLRFQS